MKAGLVLALVAACSAHPPQDRAPEPPPVPVAAIATAPSIYDVGVPRVDAGRGHPVLISMFYGSCAVACPALIDTLRRTVAELPAARADDIRIVLISFDPARDTPARLHALAAERGLDARWILDAAAEPDARVLAGVLGIRYRAIAGGQFFHTSVIVALDRDGRPLARMDGLGDPGALIAALSAPR